MAIPRDSSIICGFYTLLISNILAIMQSLLFANNVNDAHHETLGFMLQGAVPRGLGAGCCLGFLAFMYFAHSGNEKIGDQFGAVSWQEP